MFGGKDQTVVKQKTKIKQKYTVPAEQINPIVDVPMMGTNVQNTQLYGQNQIPNTGLTGQQYGQSGFQTTGIPPSSSGFGTTGLATGMSSNIARNRSSSSSSSSSSEGRRKAAMIGTGVGTGLGSNVGNIDTIGHPPISSNTYQTGNIQTGYGPTTGFETSNIPPTTSFTSGSAVNPLGKNLYGETGYATQMYDIQQPFPGQTVYVEKPDSKISKKTKQKFGKNIM